MSFEDDVDLDYKSRVSSRSCFLFSLSLVLLSEETSDVSVDILHLVLVIIHDCFRRSLGFEEESVFSYSSDTIVRDRMKCNKTQYPSGCS